MPQQRDYFAELYVAGLMGDHGWAIYFPKRDVGFDVVATAFMPRSEVRSQLGSGFKCFPAKFVNGVAAPRETFRKFFGLEGLRNMEAPLWGK